ncbi:MAG: hypothetical protein FWG05_06400, partial [Kiritimatiellaeota bacterium]|nr:hypothetical protein [Kiritimatiellota bacterium]
MKNLNLNGSWELVELPLAAGIESYGEAARAKALCAANVPGDVSDALFRAGLLPDPKVGVNFIAAAERVKKSSWWLRRDFDTDCGAPPKSIIDPRARAVLSLAGLDVHADIWLNGEYLGHAPSAFLPFEKDVLPFLKNGKNTLVVRLTTGEERFAQITDSPLLKISFSEAERGYPERGCIKRIWLRKPAYTWGWDWSPHLPTCGITDDCALRIEGE